MMMNVDIETYSSVDIKTAGVYAYAEAPDFEILLIAYKIDDEPVNVIDLTEMEDSNEFLGLLRDTNIIKTAYNANFERTCLAKYFDIPMHSKEWRCTAVHAATLGLPGTLSGVGEALGLPADKQKDKIGKSLIDYFCKPCKPTKVNGGRTRNLPEHNPEKWAQFIEYNRQDVVTENAIREKLAIYLIPEQEQRFWELDQQMNDCGIGLDMDFVHNIISYDEIYQTRLMNEAKALTGLDNPNSPTQLRNWVQQHGYECKSLAKDNVAALLQEVDDPVVCRALQLRQEMGKTSVKKYIAMEKAVCRDDRLRGILQFYGANRTGRWAGRIVQVHNLPQNKIPDIDLAREMAAAGDFESIQLLFEGIPFAFSQLIRTAFVASDGCRFVVSDFSAIEARVIAWLAGEEWRLDVFKTHGKIYEVSAAQMFHVPMENITKGSKLRQQGKIAELALGYGGAFGAIKAMDKAGSIPDDEIPLLVSNWRKASPNICKFWRNAEAAGKTAIRERRSIRLKNGIVFSYINKILFVTLPSGRKLAYYDARLEETAKGEAITYAGTNQETKAWGRLDTWGGKLVENIVQAVARDCLAEAMFRVAGAGYQIVMHVHDEMVVEVPYTDTKAAQIITRLMSIQPEWAKGLPLRGDTYETRFYKKD